MDSGDPGQDRKPAARAWPIPWEGGDQAVTQREGPPIHRCLQAHRAERRAARDHHFVQRVPVREGFAADVLRVQHQALLDPALTLKETVQHFAPFRALDLDQKTEAPHVDAEDRHLVRGAEVTRPQHGAIAAQGNQRSNSLAFTRFRSAVIDRGLRGHIPSSGTQDLRCLREGAGILGVRNHDGGPGEEFVGHVK
jgi:hypothetical protein